jgi:hypothetical protein
MTRAMADELIYNEAQNEVIFIKYLASSLRGFRPGRSPVLKSVELSIIQTLRAIHKELAS